MLTIKFLEITKNNILLIITMLFTLSACTHLHDPGNAQSANQIKDEFAKVTANDAGIFTAMLENKKLMESKEQLTLDALRNQKGAAIANALYAKKWSEIKDELITKQKSLDDLSSYNLISKQISKRLKEIAGKLPISADNLKAANTLLKTAAENQNQWFARQELFRQSIKALAEVYTVSETDEDFNIVQALSNKRDEILNTEIDVLVIDDKGIEKTEKSNIGKILDIENGLDKNSLDQLIKTYSGDIFDPDAAPGLKVVILGLAVDLADKELKRNKLELGYLQSIINILKEQQNYLSNVGVKLHNTKFAINKISGREKSNDFKLSDTVLDSINSLRDNHAKKQAMIDMFKVLAIYSIVMQDDEKWLLDIKLAILDHEYSIGLSAINAQEHEALINRGLQGLAIYHGGGITPETVANFLRAAQAVALGVIGAGVL